MTDNRSLVEVSFERTVSKAQYEPERAYAKVSTSFETDGNEAALVDIKLAQLKKSVYTILGLSKLAPVAGATEGHVKATGIEVAVTGAQVEKLPAKRGAPTKAEREAKAKALADAALANVDPLADIEDNDAGETPQISTGDSREEVTGEFSLEDEPAPKAELPITDQELQNEAGKAVQRLGDAKAIRAMIKGNYHLSQLGDAPANLRKALVSDLRNLQKDGTIKKEDK